MYLLHFTLLMMFSLDIGYSSFFVRFTLITTEHCESLLQEMDTTDHEDTFPKELPEVDEFREFLVNHFSTLGMEFYNTDEHTVIAIITDMKYLDKICEVYICIENQTIEEACVNVKVNLLY